jgi:hypothetical protein
MSTAPAYVGASNVVGPFECKHVSLDLLELGIPLLRSLNVDDDLFRGVQAADRIASSFICPWRGRFPSGKFLSRDLPSAFAPLTAAIQLQFRRSRKRTGRFFSLSTSRRCRRTRWSGWLFAAGAHDRRRLADVATEPQTLGNSLSSSGACTLLMNRVITQSDIAF